MKQTWERYGWEENLKEDLQHESPGEEEDGCKQNGQQKDLAPQMSENQDLQHTAGLSQSSQLEIYILLSSGFITLGLSNQNMRRKIAGFIPSRLIVAGIQGE